MIRHLERLATHVVMAGCVLVLAVAHGRYVGNYDVADSPRLAWAALFFGFLVIASYAAGFPDDVPGRVVGKLTASSLAVLFAVGAISFIQLGLGSALLPRFVVFWSAAFAVPWYALAAQLTDDSMSRHTTTRVALIADNDENALLARELSAQPEFAAQVVLHRTLADVLDEGPATIAPAVTNAKASVLVLGRDALNNETVVAQAATLHQHGVRVRTVSLFYEEWLGKLPLHDLERTSLMFDIGEIHRSHYSRQKRLLDVVLGIIGLPFLLLAIPTIAGLNLVTNRGPLFFRQERVGRHGKTFRIIKFRTMRPGGDASTWTSVGDAQITRLGGMLRRTHVDELPQVWNILRGDLSVIGPRPEQPAYVTELSEKLPFYEYRHLVRPGLTGWAQVKHAYGASVDDALEKLQYEFFYLRRQGWGLDLRIIARTVRRVARLRGR